MDQRLYGSIKMKKIFIIVFGVIALVAVAAVIFVSFGYHLGNDNTSAASQNSDSQFLAFKKIKEKLPQKAEEVSLVSVGDIMLSRVVAEKMNAKNDFNYPFLKTSDYLKTADLAFGNLETSITAGRPIHTGEMMFRADPGVENALKEADFSVLSLANNHTPNFGEKSLKDTFQYLNNVGIKYAGAGENETEAYSPVYLEAKGLKFAFLAYNDTDVVPDSYQATKNSAGTAFMNTEKMTQAVKEAKQKADFVIVSMHSGSEYKPTANKSQTNFAHAAIDAGAELVIGHHPHVVQNVEKYHGKYIFYSLGNFVFDQMWSEETRQGLIAKTFFNENGLIKIEFMPIVIEDYSQPKLVAGQTAENILKRLKIELSDEPVFIYNQEKNIYEQNNRKVIYNQAENENFIMAKSVKADLNKNNQTEEYSLANGILKISENSQTIWQSSNQWWVDDFALADSTGDGMTDINLSVWKAGNYGSSKPSWVKENDQSIKNHFFVFDLDKNEVKPVWQSSNLDQPNCKFALADVNQDKKQELVVLEGEYTADWTCQANHLAVWHWPEWGFTNDWRSEAGQFNNLRTEKINDISYIIADSLK